MGLQLIFVVETNEKCKSDWIYIKSVLNQYYTYGANVKISTVYMDGRGNYKKKQSMIKTMISQYKKASDNNETKVIYCFDCDRYDTNPDDSYAAEKMNRIIEASGIDKPVTFHTSRHTFATLTFASGSDLATVSRLLGHTSVATTEIYADVLMDSKVKAINSISDMFK